MVRIKGAMRLASAVGLGISAGAAGYVCPALADPIHFIGGADDTDYSWTNTANWDGAAVPSTTDGVVVDSSNQGAHIYAGDHETIQSLVLDGGLNVHRDGSLTVNGDVTNNGVNHAYFINDGVITAGTIFNPYTDDDHAGYIHNTYEINAELDNSSAIINGGDDAGTPGATWTGAVANRLGGDVDNNGGTWIGNVTENAGWIHNENHASWEGTVNVTSGTSTIDNANGSTWSGDVLANADGSQINNLSGATWTGTVHDNFGSINNDGGNWVGTVTANHGTIWNTSKSTWTGDITSSGELQLAGTVIGAIHNSGVVYVNDPLAGVTGFFNAGALVMEDDEAGDVFSAQSWSGTGTAVFDVAPGSGRYDHVVLSGDYSADTSVDLNVVGPAGRTLGNIALVSVGGANTGTLTVNNLPGNGVVSYRLLQTAQGWVIQTSLGDAPAHAGAALALIGRTTAAATQIPAERRDPCASGAWSRGLGTAQSSTTGGATGGLGLGGVQFGYDLACVTLPGSDATLGVGMTAGSAGGHVTQAFSGGDQLTGDFRQGFVGAYGDLVAGSLRAIIQSQMSFTGVTISDPQAHLGTATLAATRLDVSGGASYALALGDLSLTPELGAALSGAIARSSDFADLGSMSLAEGPTFDAHVGATLAGHWLLPDGATTVRPFLSLTLHDEVLAPRLVLTDAIGNTAALPLDGLGGYMTIGLGADLLRVPAPSGAGMSAGLRADAKLGPAIAENSLSGYAHVTF